MKFKNRQIHRNLKRVISTLRYSVVESTVDGD